MHRMLLKIISLLLVQTVAAVPYMMVDSGKPKCVTAEAPQFADMMILYDAPDLVLDKNAKNYGPVFITITEIPSKTLLDVMDDDGAQRLREWRDKSREQKKKKSVTNKELSEKQGVIDHKVLENGLLNICIRSSTAGSKNSMRFGLFVEELEDTSQKEEKALGADYHLGHLEKELNRIENSMRFILKEADFAKERDAIFHQQTDAMHSATVFWPILQVCILLATGFTQANHIVHFFKKRRII